MRKTFLPIVLFITLCIAVTSCSNGDYSANPSSNANGSINPLKPLNASEFTWGGTGKFSVKINGNLWSTDTAYWLLNDTTGANIVSVHADKKVFYFYLKDTYSGNLYNLGFKQYNTSVLYSDGNNGTHGSYYSVLGNSGGLFININDTDYYEGRFYFQAAAKDGDITNFTEGHFKLDKY